MTTVWPRYKLAAYNYPPHNLPQNEPYNELHPSRWFQEGEYGLEVNNIEDFVEHAHHPGVYGTMIKTSVIPSSKLSLMSLIYMV